MNAETFAPVELPAEPLESVRRRVDLLNRQFIRVSDGLASIDATLAEAISEHLDAIGLDNINMNRT